MKTIKIFTLGALAAATLTMSCKEKMIELNTDPGIIGSTNTEYMLLGAMNGFNRGGRDWPNARSGMMHAMQYAVKGIDGGPFVNPDTHTGGGAYNGYGWGDFYDRGYRFHSLVKDIDKMDVEGKDKYAEVRSIAATMEAFLAWRVFDVYGAAVFTEAFLAHDGLYKPRYDLYQDQYKTIDSVIKAQIDYFTTAPAPTTLSAGAYDPLYGFKVEALEEGGCNISKLDNPALQRQRWATFANVLRMKMAMRLQAKDYDHYSTVMKEVLASKAGLMKGNDDGCQIIFSKGAWGDAVDGCQYGQQACMSISLMNAMNLTNDPRRPLIARPAENDTSLSTSYGFIYVHFPDTIKKYSALALHNVWTGKTINPDNHGKQYGPDKIALARTIQFIIKNPNFVEAEGATNPMMSPTTGRPILWGKDTTVSWRMLAGPATRYWLLNGGGNDDYTNQYSAYDKNELPRVNGGDIALAEPVLTYSEQCFALALIAATDPAYAGAIAGKSTNEWYNEGIRSSITKQLDDARRVYVRMVTYENFPLIVGVNGTTFENKHKYTVTPEMIEEYIQGPLVALPAATGDAAVKLIGEQIWLSMYLDPDAAWGYWKLTGYPTSEIISYQNPVLPTTIAWEQPTMTGVKLLVPRRAGVPQPNEQNIANWYTIQTTLIGQTNPDYGTWSDMAGRIWWDVNPVK